MGTASEWQQMMFTEAGELNVALKDHFFVVNFKGLPQMNTRIGMQARKNLGIHASHPRRGFQQPITIRVLADRNQQFANGGANSRLVDNLGLDTRIAMASSTIRRARRAVSGCFQNRAPSFRATHEPWARPIRS